MKLIICCPIKPCAWSNSAGMGCLTPAIVVLCACGVALSAYAIHVERSKHRDEGYRAHCDMDETIACSSE